MKTLRLMAVAVCLVAVPTGVLAQDRVGRVIAEALKESPLRDNLRQLTDEVGGRVPGTPAMEEALKWGEAALKAAGADSVKVERFTIAQGWAEGTTSLEIAAPVRFKVRAVSAGWGPVLPATRARVVDVGEGTKEDFARAGNIGGKIALVHTDVLKTWDDLFNEYFKAPPIIAQAVSAKALAIAFIATREHDILYRHINTMNGRVDKVPQLIVAREDGERVARLIAAGKAVDAEISIPNRIAGPITTGNVVAELRGSELPNEWVVLGAHLDSWELGTGALDNGCNAALVVDALRAIKASGLQPRRSIRFILFSGEEQGMLGSRAYVEAHRSEMDNGIAAVVFDEGIGAVTGFSVNGRKDIVAPVKALIQPLEQWNATELTDDVVVGTDNLDFMFEGVPNLVANQKEANYLVNYHATSDTFDKVDFAELKKHVAMAAAMAFAIADSPSRLAPRQTRAQIEQTLHESKGDEQLKAFGLWDEWSQGKRGRSK